MRLIYVRHGDPNYKDDCLTETGVGQAIKTKARLHDEDIKAVYSSPMGRAVETASYVADDHGLNVKKLDFMHEIGWGDAKEGAGIPYEGHPWTLSCELITDNSEYATTDKWREHHYFKDNLCMNYYDKIAEGIDNLLKDYGVVRDGGIYRCAYECDDTIALFAHGGSGGLMYSHILNLPLPYVLTALTYGVCSVSIISFEESHNGMIIPRIELFNDMTHLGDVAKESFHFDK